MHVTCNKYLRFNGRDNQVIKFKYVIEFEAFMTVNLKIDQGTLMMDAERNSEMSADFYWTTWLNNSEDRRLQI